MAFTFEKTKQSVSAYNSTDIITFSNDAIITDIRIDDELQLDYTQLSKVIGSDTAAGDQFGSFNVSVSNDGSRFVVAAYQNDPSSLVLAGAVYVFDYNTSTNSWDETKLTASDAAAGDNFGSSVAISGDGDTIIVGAEQDDDDGTSSGSAYVFTHNSETSSWDSGTKLTASDGAADDRFGVAVSISNDGNKIIVGANNDDYVLSNSGSAYIFEYNSGTDSWDETRLNATTPIINNYFGLSVAMSGDGNTVAIGTTTSSGTVYIFEYNSDTSSWDENHQITISSGVGYNSLSLSNNGERIAISSVFDNPNGTSSGSAYIFEYNSGTDSWDEEVNLIPFDGGAYDYFGISVAISDDGNSVAIGAESDSYGTGVNGQVYTYEYNSTTESWEYKQKIVDSNGATADKFGSSVALSNDGKTLIVAARLDDDNGTNSGSSFVFIKQPRIMTGARYEKLTLSQSSALYGSTNSIELFNGYSLKTNLIPIENMVFKQNQTLTLYSTKNVDVSISYIEIN